MDNGLKSNELIGKKILQAREGKGFTQVQMANSIKEKLGHGYSSRQYFKIEQGDFPKFKKDVVKAIDAILGTSFAEEIYEQNVPHETKLLPGQTNITLSDYLQLMAERERELHEDKAFLQRIIEKGLYSIKASSDEFAEILGRIEAKLGGDLLASSGPLSEDDMKEIDDSTASDDKRNRKGSHGKAK